MACVASVPRQRHRPLDGLRLYAFELIDLVVLPYIFHTFPYWCACSALRRSRLTSVRFQHVWFELLLFDGFILTGKIFCFVVVVKLPIFRSRACLLLS